MTTPPAEAVLQADEKLALAMDMLTASAAGRDVRVLPGQAQAILLEIDALRAELLQARAGLDEARAERDRLAGQVQRVRGLASEDGEDTCVGWHDHICGSDIRRALDGGGAVASPDESAAAASSLLPVADDTRRDAMVAEIAGQIAQRAMQVAAGQYGPLSRWEAVRNLTCSAETLFAWVADEAPERLGEVPS